MADRARLQEAKADIILASGSASRASMLRAAGLSFRQIPAPVDEAALKRDLAAQGETSPSRIAAFLAAEKARAVSRDHPDAIVIGADQVMAFDGTILDKPGTRAAAAAQLARLSGGRHSLHSAVATARAGAAVWAAEDAAYVTFRRYDARFIGLYLEAAGDDVLHCVGACQIEALGIHLFDKVEGDFFTILGMPLLPLIAHLRDRGLVVG